MIAAVVHVLVAAYWWLIVAAVVYALGCAAWRALTALGWFSSQVYATFLAVWGTGVPAILWTLAGPDPTAALIPGALFAGPLTVTLAMLLRWWVNPAAMAAPRVREGARP